ncbi:MAG TPA: thiaminase II [Dehalococcoidia bacterium]|nr:thiaminase II [Dehalococcoidia bacterium]
MLIAVRTIKSELSLERVPISEAEYISFNARRLHLSFAENIERQTLPLRQAILAHPFVTGVGDGTLDVAKFKHYVMQDYVYLIDYSRVLALASARAPDLATMAWFARLLDETLNVEMDLHRSYCAEFGITPGELESTIAAPTTVAYTSFLLKVAHQGSFGELVASLLPCQWGYWEIGEHLAQQGEPPSAPLYCQWIRMYTAPEFAGLARSIRDLADRMGGQAGPTELIAMKEAYLTSLRFEHRFWDMAYNLEEWRV